MIIISTLDDEASLPPWVKVCMVRVLDYFWKCFSNWVRFTKSEDMDNKVTIVQWTLVYKPGERHHKYRQASF